MPSLQCELCLWRPGCGYSDSWAPAYLSLSQNQKVTFTLDDSLPRQDHIASVKQPPLGLYSNVAKERKHMSACSWVYCFSEWCACEVVFVSLYVVCACICMYAGVYGPFGSIRLNLQKYVWTGALSGKSVINYTCINVNQCVNHALLCGESVIKKDTLFVQLGNF